MGGKKRDQDEDAEERPHGLAGSHLDPDKRPRLSATSRTRTISESFDLSAVTKAVTEAYDKGASSMRLNCENLQRNNAELFGQLSAANATIAGLNGQIAQYAGQDPTLAFLKYQTDRDRLDVQKEKESDERKWTTIREVLPEAIKALGPAAAPLAAWSAQKLGIALLPSAPKNDGTPVAAMYRIFMRLQDGSETASKVIAIGSRFISRFQEDSTAASKMVDALQEFLGEESFVYLVAFLREASDPPAAAKEDGAS